MKLIEGDLRWARFCTYAILFLIVALIAGLLGFGGVAGAAIEAARLVFWVAIALFVVSAVVGMVRRS